ncbi:MAG: glycosyltransferase family 4 protein [Steroidobacteraceae bacterium]
MSTNHSGVSPDATRRRVLMVAACPFPARRGTPVRIERMAEALGRRGHEVHVATYHLGETEVNPHFTVHRIRDVPGYQTTAPGPNWRKLLLLDPRLQSLVYKLARTLRPDVIHAHHFEGLLVSLPARYRRRIPLVFDAHVLLDGELEYYQLGMPGALRRRAARTLDWMLPRAADHVISISDEISQRLDTDYGMSTASVSVVPNGVEAQFFEGRRDAFPRDGLKRIVFAGNLASYQGIEYLLQAFAHVRQARRDVRLVLVTESPTDELAAAARALGLLDAIEFIPAELARLPSQLTSADVLVNPRTKCPGVPMKLLNYMASGAPIVSFEGSSRYLVDGQSGIVVPNEDVRSFAAGILGLLADPARAERLGLEAQAFARKSLSWGASATMIERVYDRVLGDRPRFPSTEPAAPAPR